MAAGVICLAMIHRLWLNDRLNSMLGITIKQHSKTFDIIVSCELGILALFTFFLVRRIDAHIRHSEFGIRHSHPPQ